MKKILALVLLCCLVIYLLVGCGAQNTPVNKAQATDYSSTKWYYPQDDRLSGAVLYSEANESSEILGNKVKFLYVLEEKNGWLYGCWGNWLGWIKAENMQTDADCTVTPLPEFLTAEQKMLFLRATCMFNAYICRNEVLEYDVANDGTCVDTVQNEKGWTYLRDKAFVTYGEFDSALHSLFTQKYLNEDDKCYIDHNDKLYIIDAGRGAWGADVEDYTLTSNAKDKITFDVNFLFKTDIAEHRCSLPVVMVKTDDGWRFDDFTSGADDMRWMKEMGYFDPYEGAE